MGLMQIMPKTWAELRARYGLGADPYDARDNILAGAAYITQEARAVQTIPIGGSARSAPRPIRSYPLSLFWEFMMPFLPVRE